MTVIDTLKSAINAERQKRDKIREMLSGVRTLEDAELCTGFVVLHNHVTRAVRNEMLKFFISDTLRDDPKRWQGSLGFYMERLWHDGHVKLAKRCAKALIEEDARYERSDGTKKVVSLFAIFGRWNDRPEDFGVVKRVLLKAPWIKAPVYRTAAALVLKAPFKSKKEYVAWCLKKRHQANGS